MTLKIGMPEIPYISDHTFGMNAAPQPLSYSAGNHKPVMVIVGQAYERPGAFNRMVRLHLI
jgi:hypothetical protein